MDRIDVLGREPQSLAPDPGIPEATKIVHQDGETVSINGAGKKAAWGNDRKTNCLSYACQMPQLTELQPYAESTTREIVEALGFTCKKNVSAGDCCKHCKCQTFAMVYILIHKGWEDDANKGIRDYFDKVQKETNKYLFDLPIQQYQKYLDFHGMRGRSDGTTCHYDMVGKRLDKSDIFDENEPNGHRVWPKSGEAVPGDDYIPAGRLLEKWCCCRER